MRKAIAIVVAVIVLGGVGAYLVHLANVSTANQHAATSIVPSATVKPASQPIIRFNGTAFSPATYTIKVGMGIIFLNTSKTSVTIVSNPSTQQTEHPEINLTVPAGSSQGVTLTKTGSWGYYDQQNPSVTGQLIVQ
jgi:plastocyanin